MNQTYLNSTINTVLSRKPSKAIRLLLMVLFVYLFANVASAATITSNPVVGNWSSAATWSVTSRTGTISTLTTSTTVIGLGTSFNTELAVGSILKTTDGVTIGVVAAITSSTVLTLVSNSTVTNSSIAFTAQVVPTASDDVIIVAGATVEVSGTISIKSVFINGILSVNGGVIVSSITSVIINYILRFSSNNGSLSLPVNTTLDINQPGKIESAANCSNNVAVIIGSIRIAVCSGEGKDAAYNFEQITAAGGTLQSLPSSNAPVCFGTPLTFTADKAGADGDQGKLQYQWSITAPNGGGVTTSSSPTITIPTPIPGIYKATLTYTTTYGTTLYTSAKTIDAVVIPLPTAPTVVITQATCAVPTATITITQVVGETYNFDGLGYSSTLVYNSLAQGSLHTIYAKNGGGCISTIATNVTVNSLATNTWSGSAWSKVNPPTVDQNIEFAGEYIMSTDLTACSCHVTSGGWVDINEGITLKLTNGIHVSGTGRILFKDKSSLVQINNVINTGNINYERKVSGTIRSSDYTYWSSPVAGFKLGDVYLGNTSGLFYSYGVNAGTEDWQQESSATVMNPGKGYIINGAQAGGPLNPPQSPTFKGVPNNGTITFPIGFTGATTAGTSNLLGNPYPSAIDADKFLTENKNVLDGTLYFWTHNTQIGIGVSNPGTGVFAYSSDDYASYNFTGGVSAFLDTRTATGNLPGGILAREIIANKPSGKIASGQGFFATSKTTGNVTFTNAMRVAGSLLGNNSQFFKTKNPKGKTANTIEKNRVWLNLTNTQGAFKQTLIGYLNDATNDYDNLFDGESFDGNEFVDFYSVNQDKNLVIQGRALPFDENDEVPLGYRTTIDGNFTINIDQVDGSMTDQAVYIEDKLTNTVFDLKTGNYTFSTAPGTFNDRFVLRYNNKTLGTENFDSSANKVLVSNANKEIKINSFAETIDKVVIYDLLGRQVFQKINVNNNELSIANLISSHQTLVVKTVLQNGNTFTDKIIY